VARSEGGVSRKQHDVAGSETIDCLLVGVKADELPFLRHIDLVGVCLGEAIEAALETVFEEVGHGAEFYGASFCREGVGDCAGASSAAADQGQAYRVIFTGIEAGQ